jgi:hypothetical protein
MPSLALIAPSNLGQITVAFLACKLSNWKDVLRQRTARELHVMRVKGDSVVEARGEVLCPFEDGSDDWRHRFVTHWIQTSPRPLTDHRRPRHWGVDPETSHIH